MSPRQEFEGNTCPSTVDLTFKVWTPNLNRNTHRLYLLGSTKAMGAWDLKKSLEAFPTSEVHTWKVEVRSVPIRTSFEWSWLKAKPDMTDVKWERMVKRNRTVDCFGGVIHTIFGDGEEVFIKSATTVEVSTYRKVEDGQIMVMTGCAPTTGSWDLKNAIRATESPRQSGYWKTMVSFDANSTLLFKWAILHDKEKKLHLMEKESHALYGRHAFLKVVAPWNLPHVFIEDTSVCLEQMDGFNGRTDVMVGTKKIRNDAIRKWLKTDPMLNTPNLVPINQVPTPKAASTSVVTPRKTDKEKAKEALKVLIAMTPPEQQQQQQQQQQQGTQGQGATPRVPTVQAMENVDDHVKKRTEALTRQTKQEVKIVSDDVIPIKGKGQTVMNKDSDQSHPPANSRSSQVDTPCLLAGKDSSIIDSHLIKGGDSGFETGSQQTEGTLINWEEIFLETVDQSDKSSKSTLAKTTAEIGHGNQGDAEDVDSDNSDSSDRTLSLSTNYPEDPWEVNLAERQKASMLQNSPQIEGSFADEDDYLFFLSSKLDQEETIFNESFPEFAMNNHKRVNRWQFPSNKYEVHKGLSAKSSGKSLQNLTGTNQADEGYCWGNEVGEDSLDGWEFEDEEMETFGMREKRSIARDLEQQWGTFQTDTPSRKESLLHQLNLSSTTVFAPSPSEHSFQEGGVSYSQLLSHSKEPFQMAQYSNTELANAIMPAFDDLDRRAVARMLERRWGSVSGSDDEFEHST